MGMRHAGAFRVIGLAELNEQLRSIPDELQRKPLRESMVEAAAEVILADAKQRVPVDTGNLRDSLVVKPAGFRNRTQYVVVGVLRAKEKKENDEKLGKSKQRSAFYAQFVHNGTRFHTAKPFLSNAFDSGKERFVEVFSDKLGDWLEAYFARTSKGVR